MLRFWSKVSPPNADGCRLWRAGTVESKGVTYGQFWYEGKPQRAHRVAFMLTHGITLRPNEEVHHLCEVGLCCESSHLTVKRDRVHRSEHAREKARSHRQDARRRA